MSLKRIGILTSGGDCSGLNSVIRGAYLRANRLGYELIGIKRGIDGLITRPLDYVVLNSSLCDSFLLTRSGSIIYSNTRMLKRENGNSAKPESFSDLIVSGYKDLGLSGLIYVGGDGSLRMIGNILSGMEDINIIAVPKTIDNDVFGTQFSVGFNTAVEVVCESIENIRSTAMSHERVMVVEVMGRDAGFIAMYAGVASGADVILVPEFKYDINKVAEKVKSCYENGNNHCIIVVSEAVEADDFKHEEVFVEAEITFSKKKYNGIGEHISGFLTSLGFDSRCVTLGHIQRGGKTSVTDRIIGSAFGSGAVNLIDQGKTGLMMLYKLGNVTSMNISELGSDATQVLNKDDVCVSIAKNTGVYIGEI